MFWCGVCVCVCFEAIIFLNRWGRDFGPCTFALVRCVCVWCVCVRVTIRSSHKRNRCHAVHAYAGSRPHAGTSSTRRRSAPQANTVGRVLVPPGISGLVLAIQGRASAAAAEVRGHMVPLTPVLCSGRGSSPHITVTGVERWLCASRLAPGNADSAGTTCSRGGA